MYLFELACFVTPIFTPFLYVHPVFTQWVSTQPRLCTSIEGDLHQHHRWWYRYRSNQWHLSTNNQGAGGSCRHVTQQQEVKGHQVPTFGSFTVSNVIFFVEATGNKGDVFLSQPLWLTWYTDAEQLSSQLTLVYPQRKSIVCFSFSELFISVWISDMEGGIFCAGSTKTSQGDKYVHHGIPKQLDQLDQTLLSLRFNKTMSFKPDLFLVLTKQDGWSCSKNPSRNQQEV